MNKQNILSHTIINHATYAEGTTLTHNLCLMCGGLMMMKMGPPNCALGPPGDTLHLCNTSLTITTRGRRHHGHLSRCHSDGTRQFVK